MYLYLKLCKFKIAKFELHYFSIVSFLYVFPIIVISNKKNLNIQIDSHKSLAYINSNCDYEIICLNSFEDF